MNMTSVREALFYEQETLLTIAIPVTIRMIIKSLPNNKNKINRPTVHEPISIINGTMKPRKFHTQRLYIFHLTYKM